MNKLLIAGVLGVTVLGGGAIAYAQVNAPVRADANGDGQITRAEFLQSAQARFTRMDKDGNGSVSVAERREMRGMRRGGRGHQHDGMGMGMGGMGGGRAMMLERLDTDRDGRLSRAEAQVPTARLFDRLDTSRDGFVDKAERDAALELVRAMRGGGDMMPPPPPADR